MKPGPKPLSGKAMTPAERQARYRERQKIEVGAGMSQVSPVMYWYKHGQFKNDEEARGAFRLAYHQGMDGMGPSPRQWMGLTEQQFSSWITNEALP